MKPTWWFVRVLQEVKLGKLPISDIECSWIMTIVVYGCWTKNREMVKISWNTLWTNGCFGGCSHYFWKHPYINNVLDWPWISWEPHGCKKWRSCFLALAAISGCGSTTQCQPSLKNCKATLLKVFNGLVPGKMSLNVSILVGLHSILFFFPCGDSLFFFAFFLVRFPWGQWGLFFKMCDRFLEFSASVLIPCLQFERSCWEWKSQQSKTTIFPVQCAQNTNDVVDTPPWKVPDGTQTICIFTPTWGMIQFDEHIFSNGLVQPPTMAAFSSKQTFSGSMLVGLDLRQTELADSLKEFQALLVELVEALQGLCLGAAWRSLRLLSIKNGGGGLPKMEVVVVGEWKTCNCFLWIFLNLEDLVMHFFHDFSQEVIQLSIFLRDLAMQMSGHLNDFPL